MPDGTITLLNDSGIISDVDTLGVGGDFRCIRITGEYFAVAYKVNGADTLRVTSFTCDADGLITQIDTQDFANPQGDSLEYVHEFFKVADNVFGILSRHVTGLNGLNNRISGICTVGIDDSGSIGGSLLDYAYIRASGDGDQWSTRPYNCVIQLGESTYFAIPYLYEYYVVATTTWTRNPRICTIPIATDGTIGAVADDDLIYSGWVDLFYGSICHVSGDVYALAISSQVRKTHVRTMTLSSSDGSITAIDVQEDILENEMPFILHAVDNFYAIITGEGAGAGSDGLVYSLEIADDGTIAEAVTDSAQWETTRGGYNWGVRTVLTSTIAWFVASGNASDWDGQLRAFTVDDSGTVTILASLVEFTVQGVYATKILRFQEGPYYIVAAALNQNRGYIQSFEIDELVSPSGVPYFFWIERTKFCWIDSTGKKRCKEGSLTGNTGVARQYWVEGTYWHYIDLNGDERRFEGTLSDISGKALYQFSINGTYWCYIDNTGAERKQEGA